AYTGSHTITVDTALTLSGAGNATLQANVEDPILDVNGVVTIGSGDTLSASDYRPFTVAGNWTNSGTFTHNNGSVTFDGAASTITGATTFYDFIDETAGADLTFQHSTTFTIGGSLVLTGSVGNEITLNSSNGSNRFAFSVSGTQRVSGVDVSNSEVSGTRDIFATGSINRANTDTAEASPHWVISSAATVSSYIWTGTTDATTWAQQGNWDIGDGTPGNDGYPNDSFDRAIINSTAHNITTAGNLTIGELRMLGTFTGSLALQAASTFTVEGTGILISKGTLTTGGTLDVNGTLNVSGTLRMSTNNTKVYISENITVSSPGVVQKGTGNVTFDGNLTYRDNVGGTNFGRIVIDPTTTLGTDFTADSVHILTGDTLVTAGYEMDISGTMDIDGTLNAANGVDGNSTITVGGTWDMTGGLFTSTNSTVMLDGTLTAAIYSNGKSFNNLIINDGLVGYWKLDEAANGSCLGKDICDSSGNGNDLVMLSTATRTTSVATVNFVNTRSLDFDGSNSSVGIATSNSVISIYGKPG